MRNSPLSEFTESPSRWLETSEPISEPSPETRASPPSAEPTQEPTSVRVLVNDLQVTIINAATGELLRELTIYTGPDYQPTGRPKGPQKNRKPPNH